MILSMASANQFPSLRKGIITETNGRLEDNILLKIKAKMEPEKIFFMFLVS